MRAYLHFVCKKAFVVFALLFLIGAPKTWGAIDNSYWINLQINPTGDYGVAAWTHDTGSIRTISASTYNSITGWSAVTTISDLTYDSFAPILAVNDNGNAVVIWAFYDSSIGMTRLASASLPYQGSWTTPVILSNTTDEIIVNRNDSATTSYTVRLSNGGNLFATWSAFNGSNRTVFAVTGTFSNTWGTAVMLQN